MPDIRWCVYLYMEVALMWDSRLYAVNMFLLPLVNKEADLAYGRAEYRLVGRLN